MPAGRGHHQAVLHFPTDFPMDLPTDFPTDFPVRALLITRISNWVTEAPCAQQQSASEPSDAHKPTGSARDAESRFNP